ncbi:DNA-binding response regulator, OmpR family, contains REC and winged-helix (wHTH) domain [Nitrosomonas marina]|uniref:DNA-binding response regulator, OmpR family, contains REC and winged-helix (WHTH) domain n=1 Tax=Nitrosomonas marina TaxID=917 RepID=A0A1I0FBE4_9PROT|nr:response regulator transcription factor [Nitrosomonas marina]SET55540.1 DNA-binding response regulator, OmpR family, contains REC and winged-helix (wHTH) domain [Nitrosomonas marina]
MNFKTNASVLIVGCNRDMTGIHEFLFSRGYAVDSVDNTVAGFQMAVKSMYDVVILDTDPPAGAELCRRIRCNTDRYVPMLLLLARDSLESKLEGFNAGADDCMTKPVSLRELAARVKSLTKQINRIPTFRQLVDGVSSDSGACAEKTFQQSKHIRLYTIIFQLILYLIQNPNRIIKREEFEYAVWKRQSSRTEDKLRVSMPDLLQIVEHMLGRFRAKRACVRHTDK